MWLKYCLILIILPLLFVSCPHPHEEPEEKDNIIINTELIPDGLVNTYYETTFTATGGEKSAYIWSIVSGNLPGGIEFSNQGGISGIPVLKGNYQFTVYVTDNVNNPATSEFSLFISDLKMLPYALLQAKDNEEYYENLEVTGGASPYTFSILSGEFPANLTLDEETGEITGIVTDPLGMYPVSIKVIDSQGSEAVKEYIINVINSDPVIITDTEFPSGFVSHEYLYVPHAIGGSGEYTWELISKRLPQELLFNPSHPDLSGIPQEAGTFSCIIQAIDQENSNNYHAKEFLVIIYDQVRITSESCLPGAKDIPYSFQFTATGGTGSYNWEITGGVIPLGLEFDNQTGICSGTPIVSGEYTFTVMVQDIFYTEHTYSHIFTLPVYEPIEINPKALPIVKANTPLSEVLHAQGGSGSYRWSIINGSIPIDVEILEEEGILSGYPSRPGIYDFTVKCEDITNPFNYNTQPYSLEVEPLEWTIMIYLDGDNNLEPYAFIDLNEMEGADLRGTSIKVIVLIDGIEQYYTGTDNFTDTRLYEVMHDGNGIYLNTGIASRRLSSDELGISEAGTTELNMADINTLTNFITYTQNVFPADNYGLILWDHGDGWPSFVESRQAQSRAIIIDSSSNNDVLATKEVGDALRGRGISFIGFDACLMGMVEVAYEIRDCCEIMTGSEELVSGDGWEYHIFLNSFKNMTEKTASSLGAAALNAYTYHYSWENATLSVIDLEKIDELITKLDTFIIELESSSFSNIYAKVAKGSELQRFYSDYNSSQERYMMSHMDLWDFAERLNTITGAIECIDVLKDTILYHYQNGDNITNSHGLSLYFPMYNHALAPSEKEYRNADLSFLDDTRWDEFIYRFWQGDDTHEPNDDFLTAKTIQQGTAMNGYIQFYSTHEAPPDADIFKFSVSSSGNVRVTLDLRGNTFLDLVLELYSGSEGTTPVRRADSGGYGQNEQITYYARPGYVYYIKIYEKNKYVFDRSRYYSLSLD